MGLDNPSLPLVAMINHVAVTGQTGSGKTSDSKALIEPLILRAPRMYDQGDIDLTHIDPNARVCILDPIKSDWWGITLAANGKSPGLPFVILGGPHGHVPLHEGAGAAIGELVATGKLPLSIIDMSEFKMGGLQRFYNDFAEVIFKRNKRPLHLVLEEAHEFAPKERAGVGAENMSVFWSKKLATGSRTKGVRLLLCTQRTQSLHNALLGSCATLIAHKMTYPADITPIADWLGAKLGPKEGKEIARSIPSLKVGQAWICGDGAPHIHQFPRMLTFDNTRTPDGTEVDVAPPPVDRDALRALIGDAVKEAEENDVETLKARVKELEMAVQNADKAIADADQAPSKQDLRRADQEGYKRGARDYLVRGRREAADQISEMLLERFTSMTETITEMFGPGAVDARPAAETGAVPPSHERSRPALADIPPRPADPAPARTVKARAAPAGGVGTGAKQPWKNKLLAAIYPYTALTIVDLGVVSGSYHTSGPFRAALKQLQDDGFLEVDEEGLVRMTNAGGKTALRSNPSAEKPSLAAIAEMWRGKVNRFADDVVEYLAMNVGKQRSSQAPITFSELQAKLGHVHTSGPFRKGIKQMKNAGLIEGNNTGVRLTTILLEAR